MRIYILYPSSQVNIFEKSGFIELSLLYYSLKKQAGNNHDGLY